MEAKERGLNFLKLALCLFLAPALGWLTHAYLVNSYEQQFRQAVVERKDLTAKEYDEKGVSYQGYCASRYDIEAWRRAGIDKLCSFDDNNRLLEQSVWGTAGLGVLLLILIFSARAIAGASRARMAVVFGPLVRAVMVLLALSVLAQGALFVYSIFTLESEGIHRVHTGLLGAVGLGVIAVCFSLLRSAFSFFRKDVAFERASLLDRSKEPMLYSFVEVIAQRLKAEPPEQVIVGLSPNFYVTASDLKVPLPIARLTGRTLYLSLSVMRLFNKDELAAVIGHELGHFRGMDTAYSMRFAPTYSRLGEAIHAMSRGSGGARDLAKVPAVIALNQCWLEFASAERTVGRERELLADKAGAEAADARALATALIKVSMFAQVWPHTQKQNIDVLADGRMFTDLSEAFVSHCRAVQSVPYWDDNRAEVAKNVQAHPVDTHPPLAMRLKNLGLSVEQISESELVTPSESAADLLSDPDKLGEQLTVLEAQYLVAIGAVVVPRSKDASAATS